MRSVRWLTVTLVPPLLYIAAIYLATRPPKPQYQFAGPTTVDVVEKVGKAP
jgi:hypothetical protein